MSSADYGPRRLLDVTFFTAAAFAVGAFLKRFIATELAPAQSTFDSFELWMLVPVLVQGAVGFFGLAWILRDRFPLALLWVSGMLGWGLSSGTALMLLGWSFYESPALFLVGLGTALLMASMLQVGASAILKMGLTYAVGFAAAWAALVLALGMLIVFVQFGPTWLVPAGIWRQALAATPTVTQDVVIGFTAALGVAWALGAATLRDGSTVHYVLTSPARRKVNAGAR